MSILNKLHNQRIHLFFLLSILFHLYKSQEIIFKDDDICEKFGSNLLAHMFKNETENKLNNTKEPFKDFENITLNEIIKYSGTGLNDLGDYFGCKRNKNAEYYLMTLSTPNNPVIQISLGFCYYKNCTENYFQNFKNKLSNKISKIYPLNTNLLMMILNPEKEVEKTRKSYGKKPQIILFIIITLLIFELFITLINPKNKFLKAFNLINNSKSIFSVKNPNKLYEKLRVFDGIRLLSAFYVVFGHVCFYPLMIGAKNTIEIIYASKKWHFAIITSAYYAVDVFFYMSGFFFIFSIQKFLNRKINKMKILLMGFIMRFIRLLPFMLIAIFGFTYLLTFLNNGPKYFGVEIATKSCIKNYWHNLIFINNLINYPPTLDDGCCFSHGWYLACDMQFFVYSMLIVIIFNDKPKVRKYLFIITFIVCSIVQMVIVFIKKYPYNDMIHETDSQNANDQFYLYYIRPYVRVTPYLIGIFFGELFLETKLYKKYNSKEKKEKNEKIQKEQLDINNMSDNSKSKEYEFPLLNSSFQMQTNSFLPSNIQSNNNSNNNESLNSNISIEPKVNNEEEEENEEIFESDNIYYKINNFLEKNDSISYSIGIMAFILLNLVFWNSSISNKLEKGLTLFWSAMFQTFGKVIYIFSLGVLIHLTFLGKFNTLSKVLSLKFETQIARGSFGIYVVHIYFLAMYFLGTNTNFYIRFIDCAILGIGFFLFSWIVTLILGLIFESPIIVLSKGSTKN